jgi:hypothetical protein
MYRSDAWLRSKLTNCAIAKEDQEPVVSWVRSARMHRPVLFVGAGFSRNAVPKARGANKPEMLSWQALTALLRQGLGDSDDAGDGNDPQKGRRFDPAPVG